MPTHDEKLSTFKEVMARLRTSERTLRRWLQSGMIEACYAGRELRFEEKEIRRFLARRTRAKNKAS
jgi:excisionase family DNA binding protein